MNITFCLFTYFPFGGLQRDFLKIAEICCERGHAVRVLTMAWDGERPHGFEIKVLPVRALTNHGRAKKFSKAVAQELRRTPADIVVGFNKMPGLDVYYAADTCFLARMRARGPSIAQLTPRYKSYAILEKAVFAPNSDTEILLISPPEKERFIACYGTQSERFHLLPPGIAADRFRPEDADAIRGAVRLEIGMKDEEYLLLTVGSAFRTKGVDRVLHALASMPDSLKARIRYVVIGQGKPESMMKLAMTLGVADKVKFLGGRDDVPRFLFAADLLVHPARTENTGTVLVEALTAGLPVLATANCGYAFHVADADAGRLVGMPFRQDHLNLALEESCNMTTLQKWQQNALRYVAENNVTGLHEKAVAILEAVAGERSSS